MYQKRILAAGIAIAVSIAIDIWPAYSKDKDFSPTVIEAQENPVSLIVAGETPGFAPPTTHLNIFSTLFYFLPLLQHNRSLQAPFVTNTDGERGEEGIPVDYQFMATVIFDGVNAFRQLVDPYDEPAHP